MTPLALCFSTMIGCLVGSFVPIVNTELIVITAALAAPPELVIPLILIASLSQMIAKSALYLAGSGLLHLPPGRLADKIYVALVRVQQHQRAGDAVLFASATTGFPPFYVMSVASGAMKTGFRRFFMLGLLGRTLRFTVLVAIPQLVKATF